MSHAVAIVSGGLDSTTLLYDMAEKFDTIHALSFDYGQKHSKELFFAQQTCAKLGVTHDVVDLTGITHLISNSALTSDQDVPEGHYAEDNMKQTVVPNRNMIMLSIAAGVAVNEKASRLGIGVHAGDHFVYPDCRYEFMRHMNYVVVEGNLGFGPFERMRQVNEDVGALEYLYAPFIHKSKADIAYRAIELRVPFHETWSCYKGLAKHCGKCGTCVERLEAINEATIRYEQRDPNGLHFKVDEMHAWSLFDHTEYADTEFWKEAVKHA